MVHGKAFRAAGFLPDLISLWAPHAPSTYPCSTNEPPWCSQFSSSQLVAMQAVTLAGAVPQNSFFPGHPYPGLRLPRGYTDGSQVVFLAKVSPFYSCSCQTALLDVSKTSPKINLTPPKIELLSSSTAPSNKQTKQAWFSSRASCSVTGATVHPARNVEQPAPLSSPLPVCHQLLEGLVSSSLLVWPTFLHSYHTHWFSPSRWLLVPKRNLHGVPQCLACASNLV